MFGEASAIADTLRLVRGGVCAILRCTRSGRESRTLRDRGIHVRKELQQELSCLSVDYLRRSLAASSPATF